MALAVQIQLGNMAEWASALFAGLAFLVTYLLLRHEVQVRREERDEREADALERRWAQARRVSWSARPLRQINVTRGGRDQQGMEFEYAVLNGSHELITRGRMTAGGLGEWSAAEFTVCGPGDQWVSEGRPGLGGEADDLVGTLEFTDARGVLWRLTSDGQLTEAPAPMEWPPPADPVEPWEAPKTAT